MTVSAGTVSIATGESGRRTRWRLDEPAREEPDAVAIELTQRQIALVVHSAAGQPRPMAALGEAVRAQDWRDRLSSGYRSLQADRRLSHSLLAGLFVLVCLPADGGYIGVVEIARRLEMNTSTAHRYVITLLTAGLIERDVNTRKYRLATWL